MLKEHACSASCGISIYCKVGNFRGRKLSQIGDFQAENFRGLLAFAMQKDTTPPNFMGETLANSHKTAKFVKGFSLESFPLNGMRGSIG